MTTRTGAFVLALALAAGCGLGRGSSTIDGPSAQALVAGGATLLDVRSHGEWEAGHIEGAMLVPVQELERRIAQIPRERPVVVYCASGARSARATALLRAAGYDARDLGGMARWGR